MIHKSNERGFSYIDVMIALVILMVGILASAAALTANLLRSFETEKQVIAKQAALSTIESIFSARDIARTGAISGWDSIGNIGSNPNPSGTPQGVFLPDFCPIRQDLGWDGVAGTIDDACPAPAACQVPGRPDNTSEIVSGFERKIVITDLQDSERPSPPHPISRRRIDVTVRYHVNQLLREQTVSTIIANYAEWHSENF
jgi:type II secretory pathway pseudopilin PulG